MLTYNSFKKYILELEILIRTREHKKAKEKFLALKREMLMLLTKLSKILDFVSKNKINKELYDLIFQNIAEFALDLDNFFVHKDNKVKSILKELNLQKEESFMEKISEIFFDVLNFLEREFKNKRTPSLSLNQIKRKIKELK
mgnify:CR=1 FL=1